MPKVRYGISYQGSKRAIAEKILDQLPSANRLIDAFAGGCAVTHAALLSGKYNTVVANDINGIPRLFEQALKGEIPDERFTKVASWNWRCGISDTGASKTTECLFKALP